jgi:hypothetical protein
MSLKRGTRRLIIVASTLYAGVAAWASYYAYQHAPGPPTPDQLPLEKLSDKQLLDLLHAATIAGRAAATHTALVFAAVYAVACLVVLTGRWVVAGYRAPT